MKLDFKKTIILLALISFTTLGYLFTQKGRYINEGSSCFDTQTGTFQRYDWNDNIFYKVDYQNKKFTSYKNQAK